MNNELQTFDDKTIINFEYNIAQLEEVAQQAKSIDVSDIIAVQDTTKQLVKIRGLIQKQGKEYRDASNAFNKRVLSEEKRYLEIIEPIEVEYKELIEKHKQQQILEERKALLPTRKSQLSLLKITQPTEEEILSLDEKTFTAICLKMRYRRYRQRTRKHKTGTRTKRAGRKIS